MSSGSLPYLLVTSPLSVPALCIFGRPAIPLGSILVSGSALLELELVSITWTTGMGAWLLDAGMIEFAMDAGSLLDLVCLSLIIFFALLCFRPQSYVTTRFMLCFSAWQCAFMCIFLHTCHADRRVGWGLGVGVGGGSCGGGGGGLIAFCRLLPVAWHAPDVTLYRSSLAILDTLMMLRSIDLFLQSSTRSRCYAL